MITPRMMSWIIGFGIFMSIVAFLREYRFLPHGSDQVAVGIAHVIAGVMALRRIKYARVEFTRENAEPFDIPGWVIGVQVIMVGVMCIVFGIQRIARGEL